MKKILILAILVVFTLFFQTSCEKEPDTPPVVINETPQEVSFIINGGTTYNNKYITFSNFNAVVTQSSFNDTTGISTVKALGQWDNLNVFMEVFFPNDTTGFYLIEEPQPPLFEIPDDRFFRLILGSNEMYLKYINLIITQYGKPGERIKGTFNGQMYDYSANGNGELIYINNGKFDIIRTH